MATDPMAAASTSAPVRNSTVIAGLVSQLRAGQISNTELWERLQQITSRTTVAPPQPPPVSDGAAPNTSSALPVVPPAPPAPTPAPAAAAPSLPPPTTGRKGDDAAAAEADGEQVPTEGQDDGDSRAVVANMKREERQELVQRLLQSQLRRKAAAAAVAATSTPPSDGAAGAGAAPAVEGRGDDGRVAAATGGSATDGGDDGGAPVSQTLSLDDFMNSQDGGGSGAQEFMDSQDGGVQDPRLSQVMAGDYVDSPTGAVAGGGHGSVRSSSPVADTHPYAAMSRDYVPDQPYSQETYPRQGAGGASHNQHHASTPQQRQGDGRGGTRPYRSASAPRRRVHRDAQAPQYSFHPHIRPLPAAYGGSRSFVERPFEERVARWRQQRDEAARLKRKEQEEASIQGCTFRPKINNNSRITAERSRGSGMNVTERLYSDAKRQQAKRGVTPKRAQRRHSMSAAERPRSRFETNEERPLTLKEQQELEEHCTFRPKINKNRDAAPVRSRYRSQTPSRRLSRPTGMDECTFTPRVNPVKPHMGSAQQYVRTRVFDRLARPRKIDIARRQQALAEKRSHDAAGAGGSGAAGGGGGGGGPAVDGNDRPVMDMTAFLSAMGRQGEQGGQASAASRRGPRNSTGGGRRRAMSTGRASVGSARERTMEPPAQFKGFLARMKMKEEERKRKLDEARKPQYSHKPELSSGSRKLLATRGHSGGFLERVKINARRKENNDMRRRQTRADDNCTFKPKINASSARRKSRSYVEMSQGDALKREAALRLLRLKKNEEEVAGLPFKPKTNVHGKTEVTGKLNVLSDPESYLRRVAESQKRLEDRQRQAVREAELREFEQCTFKPQIHDAPAYIKRIARSMALTKAARPAEPNPKPDWR